MVISQAFPMLWEFLKAKDIIGFFNYVLNITPYQLYFTMPFAVLIGSTIFASVLSHKGELSAIFTSGLSYIRFYTLFLPILTGIFFLIIILQEYVLPYTMNKIESIKKESSSVIYDAFIPQEGIIAKIIDPKNNTAYQVYDFINEVYFETHTIKSNLPIKQQKKYMSSYELLKKIDENKSSLFYTKDLEVEFARRTAYPFSVFIVTFLALPFGLGHHRFYKTRALGIGVIIGFVYFGVGEIFKAFGMKEGFPVLITGWGSNIVFLLLAYINHISRRIW